MKLLNYLMPASMKADTVYYAPLYTWWLAYSRHLILQNEYAMNQTSIIETLDTFLYL